MVLGRHYRPSASGRGWRMRLRCRPCADHVHFRCPTRRCGLQLHRKLLWSRKRTLSIAHVALGITVLLFAGPAGAWTGSPTGTTFDVTYDEPTTSVASGPPQLTKTRIYYRLGTGAERSLDVPAISPAGGNPGTITSGQSTVRVHSLRINWRIGSVMKEPMGRPITGIPVTTRRISMAR